MVVVDPGGSVHLLPPRCPGAAGAATEAAPPPEGSCSPNNGIKLSTPQTPWLDQDTLASSIKVEPSTVWAWLGSPWATVPAKCVAFTWMLTLAVTSVGACAVMVAQAHPLWVPPLRHAMWTLDALRNAVVVLTLGLVMAVMGFAPRVWVGALVGTTSLGALLVTQAAIGWAAPTWVRAAFVVRYPGVTPMVALGAVVGAACFRVTMALFTPVYIACITPFTRKAQ